MLYLVKKVKKKMEPFFLLENKLYAIKKEVN